MNWLKFLNIQKILYSTFIWQNIWVYINQNCDIQSFTRYVCKYALLMGIINIIIHLQITVGSEMEKSCFVPNENSGIFDDKKSIKSCQNIRQNDCHQFFWNIHQTDSKKCFRNAIYHILSKITEYFNSITMYSSMANVLGSMKHIASNLHDQMIPTYFDYKTKIKTSMDR